MVYYQSSKMLTFNYKMHCLKVKLTFCEFYGALPVASGFHVLVCKLVNKDNWRQFEDKCTSSMVIASKLLLVTAAALHTCQQIIY